MLSFSPPSYCAIPPLQRMQGEAGSTASSSSSSSSSKKGSPVAPAQTSMCYKDFCQAVEIDDVFVQVRSRATPFASLVPSHSFFLLLSSFFFLLYSFFFLPYK